MKPPTWTPFLAGVVVIGLLLVGLLFALAFI